MKTRPKQAFLAIFLIETLIALFLLAFTSDGLFYVLNTTIAGTIIGLNVAFLAHWKQLQIQQNALMTISDVRHLHGIVSLTMVIITGLVFYFGGVIGRGSVYGIDFTPLYPNESFPTSGLAQLTNPMLLTIGIAGVFWGTILIASGMWDSIIRSGQRLFRYILLGILILLAIDLIPLMPVFLLAALIARVAGTFALPKLDGDSRHMFAAGLTLTHAILLPVNAFLLRD